MTKDEMQTDAVVYSRQCRLTSFELSPKFVETTDSEGNSITANVAVEEVIEVAEKIYAYLMKG